MPGLSSPLVPLITRERIQIEVRRVSLPWLGTHVLYLEEFLYDEPFERRRRVLMSLDPPAEDGTVRVRQFTRRDHADRATEPGAADLESVEGCDLYLVREDQHFQGGTRGRNCLEHRRREPQWIDYQLVVGAGMFWYRQKTRAIAGDELVEDIAAFPDGGPGEARDFICRVGWKEPGRGGDRQPLDDIPLRDRGGSARLRTPDGRELQLELHGRYWPQASRRESLVLILRSGVTEADALASGWSSLDAGHVGIDIDWLAVDCEPVGGDDPV